MDLARSLKVDSIIRLNPTPPREVRPHQTVAEAVDLMRQQRVGCVLVSENGRLQGIFTERDLTRRVLAGQHPLSAPISDVMTPDPVVVERMESVSRAIELMEEGGYRHLPVVDAQDKVVGVLSVKRIVHYLVEHFPQTVYNLPPDPGIVQREREGA